MDVKIVDPNFHLVIVMATGIPLNFDEKLVSQIVTESKHFSNLHDSHEMYFFFQQYTYERVFYIHKG